MQAFYKVEDDLFQTKLSSKSGYYNLTMFHSLSYGYYKYSSREGSRGWKIEFYKLKDLNALDHTSKNSMVCIYSIIEKSTRWNNNIAVEIQFVLLDQDLESQN